MRPAIGCLTLALAVLAPSVASGQGVALSTPGSKAAPAPEKDPTVKLVLHPAPEPRPAMKYHLLPPPLDRHPGNAAVLYGRVASSGQEFFDDYEQMEKIRNLTEAPLEELLEEEIPDLRSGRHLNLLDQAARCEYIDWQLRLRGEPLSSVLLPNMDQKQYFGVLLAAKTRLHIAEGDYDEAIHTLQTGYALARHFAQGETAIFGLVGIAASNKMSKQIETFVQQPDAPNLYWALARMPTPLVDVRPGIEAESLQIRFNFPEATGLLEHDCSAEQCREILNELVGHVYWYDLADNAEQQRLITTALVLSGYPLAKRGLIDRGYTAEEVEAMPVAKAVLLYSLRTYEEAADDLFKWFYVPYWDAVDPLAEAERKLKDLYQREVIPLASMSLPTLSRIYSIDARARQSIAALQVIEAIRLHGELPDRLDDITQVPVPIDPTTGQPFLYRRTGDTAVLESHAEWQRDALRYEITFAPKGN